jgi:hypothetical protein
VDFSVRNTGNTLLSPSIALRGTAVDGQPLELEETIEQLLPGGSATLSRTLVADAATLQVSATAGAASATELWPRAPIDAVVLTPGALPPLPPDQGDASTVPLVLGLATAFVLLLLIMATISRRRRRPAPEPVAVPDPVLVPDAVPEADPLPPEGFVPAPAGGLLHRTIVSGLGARTLIHRRRAGGGAPTAERPGPRSVVSGHASRTVVERRD